MIETYGLSDEHGTLIGYLRCTEDAVREYTQYKANILGKDVEWWLDVKYDGPRGLCKPENT
jgi:hypothetical protein